MSGESSACGGRASRSRRAGDRLIAMPSDVPSGTSPRQASRRSSATTSTLTPPCTLTTSSGWAARVAASRNAYVSQAISSSAAVTTQATSRGLSSPEVFRSPLRNLRCSLRCVSVIPEEQT